MPTPNRYWRLLNESGLSPPIVNPGPPPVSAEAFFDLTHQVQALAGMMQTIIPHIPQLMQMLASQQPSAPRQAPQQGVPQSMSIRGEQQDDEGQRPPPTEDTSENPNASAAQPTSPPCSIRRKICSRGLGKLGLTDILYFDAFQELGLPDKDLLPVTSTLIGFTGDSVSPVETTLLVTVGKEPRLKTLMVSFIVVELPSAYNAIIGRPTLNKLRVVVSTYHRAMKSPTRAGSKK
ncbi:hypothetical protein BHE74_00032130 [Ensete ventricosum]|nr:hypothetical protein BHE74_00032130 [Ensete ventricosum]